MGRLYLLLGQTYDSLAAYAKAIRLWLTGAGETSSGSFNAELLFLRRIHRGHLLPETHQWVSQLLRLAALVRDSSAPSGLSAQWAKFARPVVILAGGTSSESQSTVDSFRGIMLSAFDRFGGTLSQVAPEPAWLAYRGEVAADVAGAQVLGYIPRRPLYDQPRDDRYSAHVTADPETSGALQYWIDLLLAGVQPEEVRLVGIDGGMVAAFEYRMALSLGAKVGLLEPPTRAAAILQQDPDLSGHNSLKTSRIRTEDRHRTLWQPWSRLATGSNRLLAPYPQRPSETTTRSD